MKSRYQGLLPLAAIALTGLAASSVAFAQAQPPAPPAPAPAVNLPGGRVVSVEPFRCRPGESTFNVHNGTDDNFAGSNPPPQPSSALSAFPRSLVTGTNIYDQTASDYHFGDTFTLNPPGHIT